MHAQIGDRLLVESPVTGVTRRDGEIVGLHHDDGTPPYDVRWSDTGEVTLLFPGPDAHVRHLVREEAPTGGTSPAEPAAPAAGQPGDFGRRLAAARRRRGFSLEETAARARMAPQYLGYLEQRPSDPGTATVLRLADALDTTLAALRGDDQELPPGRGQALLRPELTDLSPQECRALLSTHGVGRIAFTTPQGPAAFPVNYDVMDDAVFFRTAPGSAPAGAVGNEVAFEVDRIDEAMSRGWSVLVVGRAEAVEDPQTTRRLGEWARSEPWAGGERPLWVRVLPTRLTGRRITPAGT
ncbi:pyridoxamine 5'-phosphate oxidase family protein [Streptomyces sp. NPDC056160]|uniref:pyridoxamine 5'-phosphate oxidase family protein n=1 Tax=Streptomyces sp. NPDC056160 TaxID=3345731 RepID=UPI0035DA6C93